MKSTTRMLVDNARNAAVAVKERYNKEPYPDIRILACAVQGLCNAVETLENKVDDFSHEQTIAHGIG